ncbi:hypothetical protein TWF569_006002 [Orbilia oligospora]|nr:hypothetical protein TWF569_006002 [Orbilia oligospora]
MKFKLVTVPIIFVVFTTIKPSIAPDPVGLGKLKIPITEYRSWVTENAATFNDIYDKLREFLQARKETCAISTAPEYGTINANPDTTLKHYLSAIKYLHDEVELALGIAKGQSPSTEDTALVTLMRSLYDGQTWEEAIGVGNVLYNVMNIINEDIPDLKRMDAGISNSIKLPLEPTHLPGHSKPEVVSRFFTDARWSLAHPYSTVILADAGQKDRWIETFETIHNNLDAVSSFIHQFSNSALDDGMDNPAYAEVLNTKAYNPRFGIENARPYTPIDLFMDVKGCELRTYICSVERFGDFQAQLQGTSPLATLSATLC